MTSLLTPPGTSSRISLWNARSPGIETDRHGLGVEAAARDVDEIVVGGGLTGLITALLLARAGRRVTVLDARSIGAVATGNSTAKLSVLQGAHLQQVAGRNTPGVTQAYVDANLAGQRWLLDFAAQHGVPVQRRAALSYAATSDGVATVEKEYETAVSAGLPATLLEDAGLPFVTHRAVRLADQAQFDPILVLAALASELRAAGGTIHEATTVLGVRAGQPVRVRTTRGEYRCERLVLATGTPILDRGLYFAKLSAERSYAASYRVPGGALPPDMYLSVDDPSRSIRTTPDAGPDAGSGELLLIGGNGHGVGRHPSPASLVDDLEQWTTTHWPGAERTHAWSAQDYATPHGVPFAGWLPRGRGRVFLATGYSKWGMTNAAQCAITLAGDLVGDLPDWAVRLRHRMTLPAAVATGIGMNAAVGKHYAVGWTKALTRRLPVEAPAEGTGVVGRVGLSPVAASTVDGATCRVSGVCPHLGAVLTWNDAEASWDCPAHGSRFSAAGRRLEGPATVGLARR
ncbi:MULTISPECIES: FAD-dependent oxidoreductase [unclassified Leifsonia]|uniref:FAD-dependent oxidoreductase n=1 Tax=unclassified Leifsonia TaxID=2663824 RepID=UPI000700BF8C|nr:MULTISPECIES: FAD-dependent oxidoreductase [unclassified Leifsonia]KQX05302.1 FAD-dependent oxidoreductase [Leifsonia sp. Root1293]KRA08935.1 FAD-dependent oxidoreductase [Leifsonia sp. Root60]